MRHSTVLCKTDIMAKAYINACIVSNKIFRNSGVIEKVGEQKHTYQ